MGPHFEVPPGLFPNSHLMDQDGPALRGPARSFFEFVTRYASRRLVYFCVSAGALCVAFQAVGCAAGSSFLIAG